MLPLLEFLSKKIAFQGAISFFLLLFRLFSYFCTMKTEKIENVVFDFGNVLLDIDVPRTFDSFAHFLGEDFRKKINKIYPNGDIFDDFEVGLIDENTFFSTLRLTCDAPVSLKSLREAWNAMLLRIEPKRLDMLLDLRKNYRVFLLSNTNSAHLEWVDGYLRVVFGFDISVFNTRFFEKTFYSHEIGLRKPNRNIYDFVAENANLNPAHTVFYDDNAQNIEAAKAAGWQAILHPIGAEIVTDVTIERLLSMND
ncbi:MAG: hypothetical protein RL757_20 [Bacteroidota bacterium]|jgi:putative hydrolase of the HAD superfamily